MIERVINEFLDSKNPEVLAISGKWGVGKTYALQEMVRAYKGANSLAWYSYVSAFGAKSIGDLRSMILVKTRPFPVKNGRVGDAVEEAEVLFAKGRGGAIYKAAMAFLEKVPYGGKHVTVLLETVATSLIRKTVVCIDDIERLGSGITMDELMGLVSELKLESQCKIILLFNEAQLGERATQYEQASEKVVDKRLAFVTTASEALDLGLPADTPLREYVVPCVEQLGISNIRTVQRIANGLRTVHSVISSCSDAVKKQAAIAVAVFAGALYEVGTGFPNSEEVVRWNWYSHAMGVGKDTIEESWRDKLHACGFFSCDEFDTEVLAVLKNGYVHGSELAKYAKALDEVADRTRLDGIFTEAWNAFHDRIDGTAEELMRKFVSAIDVAATAISPLNLNNTVKLLRELDFSDEADEVIEKYVELNKGRIGLFRLDDSPWSKDIDDEGVRQRFAKEMAELDGPLDLATAVALLIDDGRWDNRMQEALLKASPDDFVTLLRENQGEALRKVIDFLYRSASFRGTETAPIAVALNHALDKIANESKLNQIRAKRLRR
ncbi:P-loop NTPase fold protein [Burkholderia vietnamiensis]|uniref:P-loop NTPase fold protein n=1 Tax=Burkholderia vietnamiensis TaxID=60552 RepID=UPI0012D8E0B3|nr:P-loop NTPase fold protein [Burkholderia vietnamiensis]